METVPGPSPTAPPKLTARTAAVTASGQLVGRGLTLLLTVAGTAVVTRALGQEGFATWGTVLMLTAMLGFVLDPGLAPVVVRRLAQGGAEAPSQIALLRPRMILATAAYVLVVGITVALRGADAVALAAVMAAILLPRAVVLNVGTWLQAEHRLHRQTALEALTTAAGLAALLAVVAVDGGDVALAGAGVLAPAVLLAALMPRQLRPTAAPDPGRDRRNVRSVLREAAPLAGGIVLVSLYMRIGVVFVNGTGSEREVADFTFSFLFVEQAIVVAAIVSATLLPMVAARARHEPAATDALVHDQFAGVAILGAVMGIALVGFAEPLVAIIGGPDFNAATDVTRLLAPACAAIFANFFVAYLFVALRRAKLYLLYNLVGLAVSLTLGLSLTLTYGAEAAARVTWTTELVVVACAAVPFFWRSRGGRRALAEAGLALALVVACAEVSVAGWIAPGVASVLALVVLALIFAHRARRWFGYVRAAVAGPAQAN